jgi:hypothetical protein
MTPASWAASAAYFEDLTGLSGVVGAIDGSYLIIHPPTAADTDLPAAAFKNRKGTFGITLQGVCDEHGRFLDVGARDRAAPPCVRGSIVRVRIR